MSCPDTRHAYSTSGLSQDSPTKSMRKLAATHEPAHFPRRRHFGDARHFLGAPVIPRNKPFTLLSAEALHLEPGSAHYRGQGAGGGDPVTVCLSGCRPACRPGAVFADRRRGAVAAHPAAGDGPSLVTQTPVTPGREAQLWPSRQGAAGHQVSCSRRVTSSRQDPPVGTGSVPAVHRTQAQGTGETGMGWRSKAFSETQVIFT